MEIYITGASGLVGRYVITELLNNANYHVIAVSSCPDVVKERYNLSDRFTSICYNDFFALSNVCHKTLASGGILIHCAFTRQNDYLEVKRGIELARDVFQKAKELMFSGVLNISSRSIYKEPDEGCLNTEDSELNLAAPITLGKYTVELLAEAILGNNGIPYSNLRLASVNEQKTDNNMVRPLNVFVDNVISGKPIKVVGGMQVMSFIAPEDIATAIRSLIEIAPANWRNKYNIGTGWKCTDTLINMAIQVVERGKAFGLQPVDVNIVEKVINQRAGLDISKLTEDTGWIPVVTLTDMIDSLYKMKLHNSD